MSGAGFFGLTSYAPGSGLDSLAAQRLCFADIPDEEYTQAFDRYALHASRLAAELGVDGATTLLTRDLPLLLGELLQRQLNMAETCAMQTTFDTDTSAILSLDSFRRSLAALKESSRQPATSCSYTSYSKYRDDKLKHRRVDYCPQKTFQTPVTASQEVGWHTMKPRTGGDPTFPLSQTDVTLREGRSISDYFGFMA
ncbi:hypothetical protein WJX72_000541 [[Myrmecia] bisecta]|uniref:Uncharacterized protein n=1 Tax=[Myrmecia] bisecta TaxID=41462 RepID=A0AAW1PJ85_9CHLO